MPRNTSSRTATNTRVVTRSCAKKLKKPRCAICAKITSAAFSQGAFTSLKLGSLRDILHSKDCDDHPRLFRSSFGEFGKADQRRSSVCCISREQGRFMILVLNVRDQDFMTRAFSSVKPLGTVNPRPPLGIAVDARWIQPRLLQRWKRSCDSQEGQRCQQTLAHVLTGSPPAWLIDTWLLRLVPGGLCTPYVALSYVWGVTPFFHTSESTLASLQKDYGLRDRPGVPQTILDAISVTQLLGERYLWVDSLCIIQDNDKMKQTEINNMGSIFGNATITITAQQGADANYGLRGLHGISSQPRSTSQEIFRLSRKHHFMRECLFIDKLSDFDTVWMSRGWTFQEEIFSRRILVFHNDRIWWKCTCSSFTEDTRPNPRNPEHNPERYGMQSIRRLFSSTLPDFEGYKDLVRTYNSKEFTNPEDAPAAFAGIMTVLAQSFHKGFICGLPALFFNIALCWQPEGPCTRRRPRNDSPASRSKLPSWSWLGWRTALHYYSWMNFYFAGPVQSYRYSNALNSIPNIQWYSRTLDSDQLHIIDGPQKLQKLWTEAQDPDFELPRGWSRKEFQCQDPMPPNFPHTTFPRYVFEHETKIYPKTEYWGPIPVPLYQDEQDDWRATAENSLLCCRTQRIQLHLRERHEKTRPFPCILYSLGDRYGNWVGILQVHADFEVGAIGTEVLRKGCELVMISEGSAVEGTMGTNGKDILPEWEFEERPKGSEGTLYEFYNVLWVEWDGDGIAYRKGCGRVMKSAWDALEPEWIDLTLG